LKIVKTVKRSGYKYLSSRTNAWGLTIDAKDITKMNTVFRLCANPHREYASMDDRKAENTITPVNGLWSPLKVEDN
jgi:hypothetical protein